MPRSIAKIVIVISMLLVASAAGGAPPDADDTRGQVPVAEWLLLGPIPTPFPAFSNEGDAPKAADLLGYDHLDPTRADPRAGEEVAIAGQKAAAWKSHKGDIALATGDSPATVYLATYLQVPRWTKVDLEITASHAFEMWVGDQSIAKRDAPGDESKPVTAELTQGKHRVLVKTVFVPADSTTEWSLAVLMAPAKAFDTVPRVSIDPGRAMTIHDVLDGPSITEVLVSPDGKLFSASMQERRPPEGKSDDWVEIRRAENGALVRTLRDVSASSWQWAPSGHRLSYVTRDGDVATLRVIDVDKGQVESVVDGVKDLSNYQWGPDGSFVAYSINTSPEENKTGVQRLRSVSDRRAGDRDRSSIHVVGVPAGVSRQITAGEYSAWVYDIHPGGQLLLIGRSYEDLTDRPYSKGELYVLDINTQKTELLWERLSLSWMASAQYSPDGKKILATGSPALFGDAGVNVPDGMIANDYDTQAFIFDPETKEVDAITHDFNPTVRSVFWPRSGRDIFMVAEDGEYVRMFRYDTRKREYKRIAIDCDVLQQREVARDKAVAVVTGSLANRPSRLFAVTLDAGRAKELLDPAEARFRDVRIGNVTDFDFTTSAGKKIVGRIHFPPDFDKSKKWPCIAYYYGGTSPVTRTFGGRYPKNLWAAHGYVVYVLQPSGATGFGQEFSARHVNDWGKVVSGEIIEGTKKFIAANDYVDPKRVGCIGASFGGFMTELLVTKTDIFAAAVSHAGISMISSYWGEGYWGYGYNAVSAARSFPWNRPDIYVDQSPLFGVENVTTPLLLLHGTSDHNVPPGESEQMYTALKLLGKEVEYIRVEGEDHWILDYKKRIVWNDAIISWFDRWLKDEPQWWNSMYPPLEDAETSSRDGD